MRVSEKTRIELARRLRGDTGLDREALADAMAVRRMGQVELAEKSGVHRSTVWKLCFEVRKPKAPTVLALARALGICPLDLVPDTGARR